MFYPRASTMGRGVRSLFARLPSILVSLLTFTYHGPLYHYTFEPIEALERHQTDPKRLATDLRRFKSQKIEELDFVKKAVGRASQRHKNVAERYNRPPYPLPS